MPQGVINIELLGDKRLAKALKKLPLAAQKKAMRPALRGSAKRLRVLIAAAYLKLKDTGRLAQAMSRAKITSTTRRSFLRIAVQMPERHELGIEPGAPGFYPFALEFGFTHTGGKHVPAKAPVRKVVNLNQGSELSQIGDDLGKEISRQWKKLLR